MPSAPSTTTPEFQRAIQGVVDKIAQSKKYRMISSSTIYDVVALEFTRHKTVREGEEFARKRLHKILAAYLSEPTPNAMQLDLEKALLSSDKESLKQACTAILRCHASTKERLPILDTFYTEIFAHTGSPQIIMDYACAYNPFTWPWMGLDNTIQYLAYDINLLTIAAVNHFLVGVGLQALAEQRDVLCEPPAPFLEGGNSVGLLMKMVHCLEQRRRGAGWQVLESMGSRWRVVTFPTRNLAGRKVDIVGNYENELMQNASDLGWQHITMEFETELAIIFDTQVIEIISEIF